MGRIAAFGAVIVAGVLVALVLFKGGSDYQVEATFINAGQIVKGNPVQTGGVAIGSVTGIKITDDGHARIKLKIDSDRAPLRLGTKATIRQFSQSGIANRYVDLSMPQGSPPAIADGGELGIDQTTTAVDLDELFNTLDPETRKSLQDFFKNQANQFRGRGDDAKIGFQYLNPALATSSRLFNELTKDQPLLERFLVDSSKLVSTIADRRDDLAGLIGNLNDTTRALGNQKSALAESIQRLPPFMRRANTTFVNLRSALDDVDPLINASKPVAKKLGPFLREARVFASDARPTVRDLSRTIRRSGSGNDLIEFLNSVPALENIAIDTKNRTASPGGYAVNVGSTRGAFPETVDALQKATPEIALARPYTNDFLGWFDDFSTTGGGFDANGAIGRGFISLAENLPPLGPVNQHQYKKCPGSSELPAADGSNVLSQAEQDQLQCSESARSVGPVSP